VTATRPVAIAQVITGMAAAMALLYFLAGILIPLVIAFVLVVLVDAVVTFIDNRWPKAPRWAVSVLAGLTVILLASSASSPGAGRRADGRAGAGARCQGRAADPVGEPLGRLRRADSLSALVGQVSFREWRASSWGRRRACLARWS
jgi:hypothetical protein